MSATDIRPAELALSPPYDLLLVSGLLIYLNDGDCQELLRQALQLCAPGGRIYLREPVAVEQRLTLDRFFSKELEHEYSAVYRTVAELRTCSYRPAEGACDSRRGLPVRRSAGKACGDPPVLHDPAATGITLCARLLLRPGWNPDPSGTVAADRVVRRSRRRDRGADQATIDGFLPFDKSFKLRVRLLRDANLEWIHTALRQQVELDPHIQAFISARPRQCFVVTGNLDLWVEPVLERLGVRSFTSRARMRDGRLEVEGSSTRAMR